MARQGWIVSPHDHSGGVLGAALRDLEPRSLDDNHCLHGAPDALPTQTSTS